MDDKIKSIIDEYIQNVNEACHRLLEGINEKENLGLKTKWDFYRYLHTTRKMKFNINGSVYRLHGIGCFLFSDKLFLNWDFGYRSRWCGIDPWKIASTLRENKSNYVEYYDGELLKEACEQAVAEGEMFKKNVMYYYTIPIKETFSPNFPKEYDTLVIEHFNEKWTLSRNKVIDRFIRKSKRVHNQVYNSENMYVLRFFLDNKEVYSIPYDDICYPENAIKIMTDDIIRNLRKTLL